MHTRLKSIAYWTMTHQVNVLKRLKNYSIPISWRNPERQEAERQMRRGSYRFSEILFIAMDIRKTFCHYCRGPKHSSWGPWTLLVSMKMLRKDAALDACVYHDTPQSTSIKVSRQSWGVGKGRGKAWERRARGMRKAITANCVAPYH